MSRAVANTLLPAARPASTIARPRPRELPVTNHTCAIHPPLSSHPPDILEKLLKLRIGCAMGIRKDLLVTEEIAESSDVRATPFESRVSDCLTVPPESPFSGRGDSVRTWREYRAAEPDLR